MHSLTCWLTTWSRVLPEKLTSLQVVKKCHAFYGTSGSSLHSQVPTWARAIQSMPPHHTSWRSISISFSLLHQGLPSCLFPSCFLTNPVCTFTLPHACHMTCPSHCSWFDHQNNIWWAVHIINLFSTLFSKTLSLCSSLNVRDQGSYWYRTTGQIIVLYNLTFIFLNSNLEDKKFCTMW